MNDLKYILSDTSLVSVDITTPEQHFRYKRAARAESYNKFCHAGMVAPSSNIQRINIFH